MEWAGFRVQNENVDLCVTPHLCSLRKERLARSQAQVDYEVGRVGQQGLLSVFPLSLRSVVSKPVTS